MPRRKCLECERPGAEVMTVLIHRKGYSDGWEVQVCTDCRKVLESMLDSACIGHQWGFPSDGPPSPTRVFF